MSDPVHHPFVSIRVRPARLELAQLRLWELGASGLEERDETTLVCEAASDQVVLIGAFSDEAAARHALKEIGEEYDAEIIYVPSQDWATEWRRGFSAQRIGKRLLLHPSWEAVQGEPDDVVLTIDPENAFGSGDHETTRLVLRLLDQWVAGGERVLDVGCGSGVLSIAALRLGAASAIAVDIDEDAVVVARRNAEINGVAERIEASARPLQDIDGAYDIVLANIETRVLVHMPEPLQGRLAAGGILILSGILRAETDELLAAYAPMRLEECVEEGEWCACLLRPAEP
ncbi:MAG: 50S ribosomal protein L11 methyltransferase [Deltaproteobacteria bacterium]|nr:50S ribosomal protein L11 methyltransferase [Deltaproteobacteria bacterium]MBW1873923.1 50S ribosomal protein L11 methyltransferase [Deltaproteobacteria bacterium]MBW2210133.1 50S ribosomal protein L11 methyltransferase [Deltaproteobacteria bacterium]MBW2212935.1 50S ribosomal protein L11 methyltransferase [Deltaproteobacteria bacterium]MBW2378096.1 50S ribosomal protein L11 methyltransferase [Deltaproteobacteria bacterium]